MGGKMTIPYNIHKFKKFVPSNTDSAMFMEKYLFTLIYLILKIGLNVIKQAISAFGKNVTIKQKKLFYINYPFTTKMSQRAVHLYYVEIPFRNVCLPYIHCAVGNQTRILLRYPSIS